MKEYEIIIDVTSTTWETCSTMVEANSLKEAIEKFENDPFATDWDGWEHWDSETRYWEVNEESTEALADHDTEWTHIEDVLWYILWLKETADDKEVWYNDNCAI